MFMSHMFKNDKNRYPSQVTHIRDDPTMSLGIYNKLWSR
jgi:hypothetical protein